MKEFLTDLLDFIGLLLFAAGAAAAVWQWLHWTSLAVAGTVVLLGSALAAKVNSKEEDE